MSRTESKINNTLKSFGDDMMSPVSANWEKSFYVKSRKSNYMEVLAKRVVRKASALAPRKFSPEPNVASSDSNSK